MPTTFQRTSRGVMAATFVFAAGCSGLFEVENPQAFGDADLDSPVIITNVANGAEGQLHQAFDDWVVVTALSGDEIESTSTWIDWEDLSEGRLRRDWPTGGSFSGPMDQLLRARFSSQSAKERVERVLGSDAAASPLMVQLQWADAFADLLLGAGYCEGPLVPGGPRSPNTAFFPQAVTKLNVAIDRLAGIPAAAQAQWRPVLLASRARANLLAGNYAAALTDAEQVPIGFVKNAIYSEATAGQQSWTGNQLHQNRNRSGGLRRMYHDRVLGTFGATASTGYLRDWANPTVPDPRMAVTRTAGQLGVNNRFAYFGITKYSNRAANQPLITGREMKLVVAEVHMRNGNYGAMTTALNELRSGVGLSPIAVPSSETAARDALLNERKAELFVEGQRMYDLHRFDLVRDVLGPGRHTMLPLSRNEILNNPSMVDGEGTCPAIS